MTTFPRFFQFFAIAFFVACIPLSTSAQEVGEAENTDASPLATSEVSQEYHRATVLKSEQFTNTDGLPSQRFTLEYCCDSNGNDRTIEITETINEIEQADRDFSPGDKVIILRTVGTDGETFYLTDRYRLSGLAGVLALFFLLTFIFARKKSLTALLGLVFSGAFLMIVIVPAIADGKSPILWGGIGAIVIAVVAILLAHGVHKRTILALQGTIITILLAMGLTWISILLTNLTGKGSEDALFVQTLFNGSINLRGLLFAGIIIGTLGVLDDVTTALTATIEEFHEANPKYDTRTLFSKGMNVGREHIVSLINTLFLAYAGASLPLLLLFTLPVQPFWVTLNSQFLAEEIVRTLVGSSALVLAVPITTALAARSYAAEQTQSTSDVNSQNNE